VTETTVTVRKQWITIAVFSALGVAATIASVFFDDPREKLKVFDVAARLIWWLGHAVWLSMDRSRRGLETGGAWRYAVIFLGPLAIWFYLLVEYRARALYLIPLSLGIYLVIGVVLLGSLKILGAA